MQSKINNSGTEKIHSKRFSKVSIKKSSDSDLVTHTVLFDIVYQCLKDQTLVISLSNTCHFNTRLSSNRTAIKNIRLSHNLIINWPGFIISTNSNVTLNLIQTNGSWWLRPADKANMNRALWKLCACVPHLMQSQSTIPWLKLEAKKKNQTLA